MAGHPIKPLKKSTKGSLTRAAHKAGRTVTEEENAVLKNPDSSEKMRKKAQFAKNAKTWNHK